MRHLGFIILVFLVSGCAGTNYPLFVSPSRANRTDEVSRSFIRALAAHDQQGVIATTGDSADQAAKDIAQAPKLAIPPDPHYLLDMPMEESYARQYAVALIGGGEVEIRCWFNYDPTPLVRFYQVFPRTR